MYTTLISTNTVRAEVVCFCYTNTNPWPYTVPSFIGNNYFCDTGDHDARFVGGVYYPDEPLLTDRSVVLIVPAASSTILHGFAWNYHNQPVTILRLGSAETILFPVKMWLSP